MPVISPMYETAVNANWAVLIPFMKSRNSAKRMFLKKKLEQNNLNYEYRIRSEFFSTADPSKPLDTYVNIEYLTWPIIRYKREVLFGWVDLLVSFGGIAGLFLGFSLLSGVEIIYYFTLRACCMLYKNRVSFNWTKKIHFFPHNYWK